MIDCKVETKLLENETRVVSVAGELDLYTAPPFEEQIQEALNNGHARIVIDLSACEFLDSTALRILITANERLGEQDDRLVLVAPDRNIVKIFQVTGLDRAFTIVPPRAAALNGATGGMNGRRASRVVASPGGARLRRLSGTDEAEGEGFEPSLDPFTR